jgi:DNA primase
MARAIIAGLILHPEAATDHAQALAGLALGDPMLERVRDVLVGAAFGGTLESGDTRHILAEAGLGRAVEELRHTIGLAFSFLRSDADPERARRDLGEAIDVLVTRPQIDKALAEATRAFAIETDDAAFAEQQRLQDERREIERRLMDLMQPDAGA